MSKVELRPTPKDIDPMQTSSRSAAVGFEKTCTSHAGAFGNHPRTKEIPSSDFQPALEFREAEESSHAPGNGRAHDRGNAISFRPWRMRRRWSRPRISRPGAARHSVAAVKFVFPR